MEGRMRMNRVGVAILTLAICCNFALGATWYVRPNGGAYGSENGADWNNAFDGFSDISWSGIACGDTIWVAGGTYTQDLVPQKKCTSSARLNVRRARGDAPACTGAAGWSSSYDTTVHQTRAGIALSGDQDYITVSGRTTASGGSHGWWIDFKGATSGPGIEFGGGADYNAMEYIDIEGPGYVTYTSDGRGIDATPSATATGNTFSHLKVWDWESSIYLVNMADTLFEYIEMYNIGAVNSASFHPNGLITWGAPGMTVRYSQFHSGPEGLGIGEGIFCEQSGGCTNWKIYGNIFYDLSSKVIQITSSISTAKIYNNVFARVSYSPIQIRSDQGGACAGSSETRNNIFYSSSGFDNCGTVSNNLQTSSGIFVSSNDFHITSAIGSGNPRNAGYALTTEYGTDMDGNPRGADGAWDIGAYEYASPAGSCTLTLNPGADVASAVSGAASGSTICLNNGNYGDVALNNIDKTDYVTIRSTNPRGAVLGYTEIGNSNHIRIQDSVIGGSIINSCSQHIQIMNNKFTDGVAMRNDGCSPSSNLDITLDGNTFDNLGIATWEGRLSIAFTPYPSGITIKNNIFGDGGCSDGIQLIADTGGVQIGPGNIFRDLVQGSCGPHVDAIQAYGAGPGIRIEGNYFVGNTVDIGIYDGGDDFTVRNNIFDTPDDVDYSALQLGSIDTMLLEHNTFKDTLISSGSKPENSKNTNWIVQNNIFDGSELHKGADPVGCGTNCIMRYNLKSRGGSTDPVGSNSIDGDAAYVGVGSDSNWDGWRLASTSPGKNAGSDGLDMGSTYFGSFQQCVPTAEICGNGIDEDCSGADKSCKCHVSDADSDGTIATIELNAYISNWLSGSVQINDMMGAIRLWKSGCLQ
jgi:hypothetical protein